MASVGAELAPAAARTLAIAYAHMKTYEARRAREAKQHK